ncbi:hypothetical protein XM50_11365 [Sphingomonas sp. Ag1]|jgi:4'-phosphopantetheinyl transferase EntD|nr:hypothetical protein XM50_11365 [Sphingomonas sp. Ag1]
MEAPPTARQERATILFSAKESFYKAQFSWRRRWLDFRDVHVVVEGERLWVWDLTEPGSLPYAGRQASTLELVATTFCCTREL